MKLDLVSSTARGGLAAFFGAEVIAARHNRNSRYALERVARDSRPDHGPIMEILTAFVRHGAVLGSSLGIRAPDTGQA